MSSHSTDMVPHYLLNIGLGLFFFAAIPENADPLAIKKQVFLLQKQIATASENHKGRLLFELSLIYLQDQNLEEALKAYLTALEYAPRKSDRRPRAEELELYDKILAVYIESHLEGEVFQGAERICKEVSQVLKSNPDFTYLQFLLAASNANLGEYQAFFRQFYESYQSYPDCFMAQRTKAVLYTILYDRSKTSANKEEMKKSAYYFAYSSWKMFPADLSLCKMIVRFSPDESKSELMEEMLTHIVHKNYKVARNDIEFFVRHAVDADQKYLAQMFLDKAREWYSYSQAIETAQKYIDRY